MRTATLALLPVLLPMVLLGCSDPAPPPAAATAGVALESIVISREAHAAEVQFDGSLEAVFQSTVAAETNARVEELPFDVGDYVEKGQVIVRFRAAEQRARAGGADAAVREAEARLTEARTEYQRIKKLFEDDVVTRSMLDSATAKLASVQAQVESARAAAKAAGEQADYTEVRAPYSGIVVARHIEVGESATVGKPLMTGLSLEHLRVVVDVPQQAIGAVYARRQARVILSDGRSVEAGSLRIPPSADPQTHSFRVQANLPEADYGVYPGTLVKVAFATEDRELTLVPASVLVQRSELTAVYVLDAQDRPLLRYLRLGTPLADGRVPVLSGLSAGDRVAVDPVAAAQWLRAEPDA